MPDRSITRVCHLTSVHNAFDTRILWKECVSLARAGYDVTLIAPVKEANCCPDVVIHPYPFLARPFLRLLVNPWRMLWRALRQKADLYHFHDPELIPTGILLRLLTRKPVIYDVHEDVAASMETREYIPRPLLQMLQCAYRGIEWCARKTCTCVLAEKYYKRVIPEGTCVLNYPILPDSPLQDHQSTLTGIQTHKSTFVEATEGRGMPAPPVTNQAPRTKHQEPSTKNQAPPPGSQGLSALLTRRKHWLLYTGSTTRSRGALEHARISALNSQVGVYLAGRCSPELADDMNSLAAPGALLLEGVGEAVPRQRLDELTRGHDWLAGLAVFPDAPHYREKELTKFFEYMQAGMPVLCSNFPAWKTLIEDQGLGLTVDPDDPEDQRRKIQYLIDHPDERRNMGERGRQLVHSTYNWEHEFEKLKRLYAELLGGEQACRM